MQAVSRFYSTTGRTSTAGLASIALAVAILLFALSHIDWTWGIVPNVIAGAIGGAAIGKLFVATVRRLRDAGIDRRLAGSIMLGAGIAFVIAIGSIISQDPPWAQFVLIGLQYGVPALWVAALLWPSRPAGGDVSPRPTTAGMVIAAASIIMGAAAMGAVAWLSIGMDAANRRNAAFVAAQERGPE